MITVSYIQLPLSLSSSKFNDSNASNGARLAILSYFWLSLIFLSLLCIHHTDNCDNNGASLVDFVNFWSLLLLFCCSHIHKISNFVGYIVDESLISCNNFLAFSYCEWVEVIFLFLFFQ